MLIPTTCFNCESACGLLAYVDKDDLSIKKVEGNPAHPGSRGRNCAKGPATINQVDDPERILHPLRRVGERGGGQWERVSWDDRPRRHRRPDPHGDPRGPPRGGRSTTSAGPARTASPSGSCRPGASTGTTATPTSAPPAPGSARRLWGGYDRPSPDHANAKVILLFSSHLETGHYFNPHAQRIMEGKQGGAKLVVVDPRMSNTAVARRPVARPVAGQRGRDPAGGRLATCCAPARSTRPTCGAGSTGGPTWPSCTPSAEPTFETFLDRLEADYAELHVRVRRRGGAGPGRADPRAGRADRAVRPPARPRTSGARRPRATSAAGRWPAACGSSWR